MIQESKTNRARKIFIPLLAAEIIWHYVEITLGCAAKNKISATAKLSRAVRTMHTRYKDRREKAMTRQQIEIVQAAAEQFRQECAYTLAVMRSTIYNEINRKYVNQITYTDVRVAALCSIIVLRALRAIPEVISLPDLRELDDIMSAYVSPYDLDVTNNIKALQQILARKLMEAPDMECQI